ncbi:MAG: serine/threonine-protein phosphatase [Acidimicrobiales bacterium]|nr:serine/threonine-protein phosphatase [Acidimicrobiales bacterium]
MADDRPPVVTAGSASRSAAGDLLRDASWGRRRALGVAVAVAGAAGLTALVTRTDVPTDFRPAAWYLVIVVLAALLGGRVALAVAVVATTLGLWWGVATPMRSFGVPTADELWGIAGFVVAALTLGLLVNALETALRERDEAVAARVRLEADVRARDELEAARAGLYLSELQRLQDRRVVEALQEAMIPQDLPEVPGFELDASYTPATPDLAVGGDWFDAFLLDDRTLAVAVGDVSGHGLEAAALMAQLRNAKRAFIFEDPEPGHVLGRLNHFLYRLGSADFATVLYGLLDLATGELRWATAGHPPPIFFGGGAAAAVEDVAARGPLLGFRPEATYGITTRALGPLEGVLLYSDGLVERRGAHLDDGIARIADLLVEFDGEPAQGMCERLVSHLDGGHEGRDDVCQLIVRRRVAP